MRANFSFWVVFDRVFANWVGSIARDLTLEQGLQGIAEPAVRFAGRRAPIVDLVCVQCRDRGAGE